MTNARQPSLYLTHGGGPCFFMEWDPPDTWDGLRAALVYDYSGFPPHTDELTYPALGPPLSGWIVGGCEGAAA